MTTASPQRTLWLAAGGLLAAFLTLWAGFCLVGWTVGSVERDQHHVLRGQVSEVQVDGTSGDVTLVPTGGKDAIVDSHAEGTLWLPDMQTRIDGGHVTVRGHCRLLSVGRCEATFVVRVPKGTPVRVRTASGDVRASGLDGPVDLKASSGDMELSDLAGDVSAKLSSGDIVARRLGGRAELETSSGDIDAGELSSEVVNARATSGDVFVDLIGVPRRVDAAASSGDVSIAVPDGGEDYDAQVATSSGDRRLGVRSDPDSSRSLTAVTSSGDASIRYR
jgi:hypothetical protein